MKKLMKILSVATVILFIVSCNSDDEMNIDPPSFTLQDLNGAWRVTYFWDQTVRTNEYLGYLFRFSDLSLLEVDTNNVTVKGSYDLWIDNNNPVLNIYFEEVSSSSINDKLRELKENWIVKKVSENNNIIEFEERDSDNPPEILHFTRINN